MNWVKARSGAAWAWPNKQADQKRTAKTDASRSTRCKTTALILPKSQKQYMTSIYTMIDLTEILGFDWDEGNLRKSIDKHKVSRAEAEQVFVNVPLLLLQDPAHSEIEPRFHAYGRTHNGRYLQIAFTLRRNATFVRIISARPMSVKERARYGKET